MALGAAGVIGRCIMGTEYGRWSPSLLSSLSFTDLKRYLLTAGLTVRRIAWLNGVGDSVIVKNVAGSNPSMRQIVLSIQQ